MAVAAMTFPGRRAQAQEEYCCRDSPSPETFYDHGTASSYLDERMRPLHLTDADLVEFLRSLTSDDVLKQCLTTTHKNQNPVKLPKS
jgi:hypothetical protein